MIYKLQLFIFKMNLFGNDLSMYLFILYIQ